MTQSQQSLTLAARTLDGLIYCWDLVTHQVERFPHLQSLIGYDPTEVQATMDWWVNHIHPEDVIQFEPLLQGTFTTRDQFTLNYRFQHQNRQYLSLRDRGLIIRSPQGSPLAVVGTILNVSAQKRIDAASRHQIHSYRQLVNNIPAVLFQTDSHGIWTFLNQAWTHLTRFSIAETLGQSQFNFIHPEDQPLAQAEFSHLMATSTPEGRYDARFRLGDGSYRWMQVHLQPWLTADQCCLGTVGILTDIAERKQTELELIHNAYHDHLTALPNRTLFMNRLEQMFRKYRRDRQESFAALFLDLDHFKTLNDSLGHRAGDQLLVAVSQRLKACLRPGDTVARLGGDEFTLLIANIQTVSEVTQISERILNILQAPFFLENRELFITASIGIAFSDPHQETAEELLQEADMALYRAKAAGKNRYEVFQPFISSQTISQLQLESDLQEAVTHQTWELYFHPVLNLASLTLRGVEAVLRWQHPTQGMLPPSAFWATAESTGLVPTIEAWMLREVCQQLSHWQTQWGKTGPLQVALALSSPVLHSASFADQVEALLTEQHIDLDCLRLIFDAQALLTLPPTLATLSRLHDLGVVLSVRLGIDQVQMIPRLAQFPLDWVQISPHFLGTLEVDQQLKALHDWVTTVHRHQLKVLAAGIETTAQLAQVQALDCEYGQGEYFSPAIQACNLDTLILRSFSDRASMTTSLPIATLILRTPTSQTQLSLSGQPLWSIGRSPDNSIVLPDRWASRNHAQIRQVDTGEYFFIDLGSGNGSFVNGERVTVPVALNDGDIVTIGRSKLKFHHGEGPLSQGSVKPIAKQVLMLQNSRHQGEIWREILTSQGIALTWLSAETDLPQALAQMMAAGQGLPNLLLVDMTVVKPNPYSFCRWCQQTYPGLKVILTSGNRTSVPPSERQWAIHQGSTDLIPAFPEHGMFASIIEVIGRMRLVFKALNLQVIQQDRLSEALMTLQNQASKQTVVAQFDR
nr:diguanylate cyclase [Petrachloros mirabilis]